MSEYRRFVAYIYQYQNGRKQKNIGYLKVDARNQSFRMQIQMQMKEPANRKVKVYGFVREEGVLLGILLGEGVSRNGNVDIRLALGTEALNHTAYGLEHLSGVWLKDESDADYISVWDDENVVVEQFVLELPKKEEVVSVQAECTVEETIHQAESGLECRWQQFCNHYPKIHPFEAAAGMQCLQIMPKDVSFLGEKEWQFGQNPFLRQGFLRYGHLILARGADGRYLLGVPGMYYDAQDRHLARMYGFGEFKKADNTGMVQFPEGETGEKFGYWYHFLN